MFEWNVEALELMNNNYIVGKVKYFYCETNVSRKDKIAFVDGMTDGKLSYILGLIEQFKKDKDSISKQTSINGDKSIKTVSLKEWIKKNDTKYGNPIIADRNHYGMFNLLGCIRHISEDYKRSYDVYDDLVDEVFHRQLLKCEQQEKTYFLAHDEYSILKSKLKEYENKYNTLFGVHIMFSNDGKIAIYDGEDYDIRREITIEELQELIFKYKQIDDMIVQLTKETHIVY